MMQLPPIGHAPPRCRPWRRRPPRCRSGRRRPAWTAGCGSRRGRRARARGWCRRVVAEQHHLDALQAHHAIGLGPAPVVADAHADIGRRTRARPESRDCRLEVALLEMLERLAPARARRGPADGPCGTCRRCVRLLSTRIEVLKRRCVAPFSIRQARRSRGRSRCRAASPFRTAAASPAPGISRSKKRVDLVLVAHPPARKERRQRELGKHDEVAARAWPRASARAAGTTCGATLSRAIGPN